MYRLNHKMMGSFATWVAINAVVLNALWPLIAQLKPELAAMQMEECSEPGMHHAAAGVQDSAPAQPAPLMPYCAFNLPLNSPRSPRPRVRRGVKST